MCFVWKASRHYHYRGLEVTKILASEIQQNDNPPHVASSFLGVSKIMSNIIQETRFSLGGKQ